MYVIYCLFLTSVTVTAIDLYAVRHSTYYGKVLRGNIVSRHLMFGGNITEHSSKMQQYSDRSLMDSQCRRKCILLGTPNCRTFQTYWTTNGSFYCELLNTRLCHACSALVNQGPGRLNASVWEIKSGDEVKPTFPCVEYPDWKVKGNCSECNKIGYYGRNCSLRSSCASYHYDPGAAQRHPTNDPPVEKIIAPCFTGGVKISVTCRAQFTRWFSGSDPSWGGSPVKTWWNESPTLSHTAFLSQCPDQMKLASETMGPRGLKARPRWISKPWPPLNTNTFNGLNAPLANAPLLKGYEQSCGPMWLYNNSISHNATHINSCAAATNLFGSSLKWNGHPVDAVAWFVDIDYFDCPED